MNEMNAIEMVSFEDFISGIAHPLPYFTGRDFWEVSEYLFHYPSVLPLERGGFKTKEKHICKTRNNNPY